MDLDWKDALGALRSSLPEGDPDPEPENTEQPVAIQREPLHVITDRRMRKGKTATIVEGFLCDDDEVNSLAAQLKKHLGTGGSARGGEILLQGDFREKTSEWLRAKGYKVK